MRILLINPPPENTLLEMTSGREKRDFIGVEDFGAYPHLGLLYIASYLKKNSFNHDIFFIDCPAENISHIKLNSIIRDIKPDITGITSFTISLIDVCKTARTVRKHYPDSHICMGGHHTIAFPFYASQLKEFDSIIAGEGEIAFTQLVDAIEKKNDITKIKGLYTATSIKKYCNSSEKDNRFLNHVTVPFAYIENIDSLPPPDRNFIKHTNHRNPVGRKNKLATIISSRGCPFKCTYCDVPYKHYRGRSIGLVLDEVEKCLEMGYNEFHFFDDTFNITENRLLEFCDEIHKREIKFDWDFRGRVNSITKKSLTRAKKSGCWMISFGVETGSDRGLKAIKKDITTHKCLEAFKLCKKIRIKTVADFMIGFPFEKTREDIKRNIDFLFKLNPDFLILAVLMLFPCTEIYKEAQQKGLVAPDKWRDFSLIPSTKSKFFIEYWTEHFSAKELISMRKKIYLRFYLRPGFIIKTIISIRSFYEFTNKFKGFLSLLR